MWLWRRILGRLVRQRQPGALGTTLRQNASRAGAFRAIGAVPCVPSNQESPSRGSLGLPWSPLIRAIKPSGPHRDGTKVSAPSCGFAGAAPGEDVIAKLINELLLLTCMGAFIASATYAVTLLH